MPRIEEWWSERPHRSPAEYACELARARFWSDPERRFIMTPITVAEAIPLLDLEEELAHGLVLVLSQLPHADRLPFAERFYAERDEQRPGLPDDRRGKAAAAAAVALLAVELTESDELESARIADILQATAQGDDLSWTPDVAAHDVTRIVANVRRNLARGDSDIRDETADGYPAIGGADVDTPAEVAAAAVIEALAPASETVALNEVVARAAWAAVHSWDRDRVLKFLLTTDGAFGAAAGL